MTLTLPQNIAAICLCILLVWLTLFYVVPPVLLWLWRWINRPGKKKRPGILIVLLCVSASPRVMAAIEFTAFSLSTNHPAFDFTAAAGSTAYWHSSNFCNSVTFTITGAPGIYDLQWNYALGNPHTNWSGTNYAIIGHGWLNVYPPITNPGSITLTFPAKPSPESYWRLKQR